MRTRRPKDDDVSDCPLNSSILEAVCLDIRHPRSRLYFRGVLGRFKQDSSEHAPPPLLNKMSVNENPPLSGSQQAFPAGIPTLVEVTDQIASPNSEVSSASKPQAPQVVFVSDGDSPSQPTENQIVEIVVQRSTSAASDLNNEPRFLVDPFDQALDGPIPVMTSLPVLKAIEMTEQVVSRQKTGDHYAWRLKPGPYPDLGNIPQVKSGTSAETGSDSETTETADELSSEEVVAEGDSGHYGDNFYAQAGDVISIDGNQGYDHIDLRSYDISEATFQPGSILLTSNTVEGDDSDDAEAPIIIRHRGIEFAIFRGEERVELF